MVYANVTRQVKTLKISFMANSVNAITSHVIEMMEKSVLDQIMERAFVVHVNVMRTGAEKIVAAESPTLTALIL